ncbi:MAG TPA: DUF2270 domain-containing protein [Candidatus Polarisedimenticolaceae bacterium]|nr:DUF2270 domain-containing protein [Candidatus Polarisedimenticolaceae bacterium]
METASSVPTERTRFEDYPLTRQEYINVMVHFYRGEIHRSTSWRQRLDNTTNWAVLTTAGMISFALGSPQNPHIVLLLSNLIILVYLVIEARRFRYFEVFRARVRMLEENFLIPVVTRHLESPMISWREMMAMDLDLPKYKTTVLEAFGFRLRRNFFYVFLIILGAWLVKVAIHPEFAHSFGEMWTRMGVGSIIPPSVVVLAGLLYYGGLIAVMWYARHTHGGTPEDEIAGLERNLEQWKL